MSSDKTTIALSRELVEKLKQLGRKGERYEDVIRRLLEASEGSEETSRN
jgi:predicted CopG family antitoxin